MAALRIPFPDCSRSWTGRTRINASFHLTAKARADLIDIGRYTQRTWCRDQRNRYLSRLDEAFYLLAQEPDRGRPCEEIRQGYRKYYVGRHVIFYRQSGPDTDIIRILHERMDIDSRLAE